VAYTYYQVTSLDLGAYVTVFSYVYAARFNSSGTLLGQVPVATTSHNQSEPSLSMDANGNFAVAYTYQTPTDTDIHLHYYDNSGALKSGDIWAASTASREDLPSVALDNRGDLIVVWTKWGKGGPYATGVSAQQYRIT
jgi:hypothetical protein